MHRAPDAFLHQVVGGRWRLLQVLGATEHGTAFRVETLEDGRPARMELWDQRHVERRGELARFEREARTLSRVRHERFVSVIAFGVHEGCPFLVSDLPAGQSLRDQLGKPELTVRRALFLGLQLCEGLRHLHGHGVVHRALRPDNLWLTLGAGADALTIGLPRFGQPTEQTGSARDRLYLPPQRSGARVDLGADLYAAGMLLYAMCTGREPLDDVAAAIAGGEPVPPPRAVSPERGISEGLERVILRAVAPAAQVRFRSAEELMAALQSAGARPTSPIRLLPQRRPRQWRAVGAAAFAAVALLGAGALRSSWRREPLAPPAVSLVPSAQTAPAAASVPPAQVAPLAQAAPPPQVAPPAQEAQVAEAGLLPSMPAPAARVAPAATPPVEAASGAAAPRGPVPVPEAAAPIAAPLPATVPSVPSEAERRAIWSLLDGGHLDEGAARIKALVAKNPAAAWPHLALGVLDYRKYWRRDSVRQWRFALEEDAEIRHDAQFGAYLCFMLDDAWAGAGATGLLDQLGARAFPLLEHCVASAKTPRLRAQAARALSRLRPR